MRFRASPLMVAVALGLVNASVLSAEAPSRSNPKSVRAELPGRSETEAVSQDDEATEDDASA